MHKFVFLLLLTVSHASYGQKGKFNPFKLIVLQPDTAIIDSSLYGDIDSIQIAYLRYYYSNVKRMEEIISFNNYPPEEAKEFEATKEKIRKNLPFIKAREEEVKKFKYFQTLSTYSTQVYNFYFNEYEPFSAIVEYPHHPTNLPALRQLADSVKADYIIFFTDIHTDKETNPFLQLTTSLYSHRDDRIILSRKTEGDYLSKGEMWTCGPTPLSCLLINVVRTSSDAVTPELAKRQLRK
jgi:hypothetical protein